MIRIWNCSISLRLQEYPCPVEEPTYRNHDENEIKRQTQPQPILRPKGMTRPALDLHGAYVEGDGDAQEQKDKPLLQQRTALENLEAIVLCADVVVLRSAQNHDGSDHLNDKARDVCKHERPSEQPALEEKDPPLRQEVVYHSAHGHVNECINPQRSKVKEKTVRLGEDLILLFQGAEGAKHVACCLPHYAHDEDPTVRLAVDDGLNEVGGDEYPKHGGESGGRCKGRVVLIVGIAGVRGDIAVLARDGGCARGASGGGGRGRGGGCGGHFGV